VQHAFYGDPSVLTISTHERGDYLFPGTGFVEEAGVGAGVGYSVNLPLEPFTDSSVYLPAFEQVVPPRRCSPRSGRTSSLLSSGSTRIAPTP
jgi:acetoin utilization protein AcuC